ncbi:MAG: hypothetical protein FWH55_05945 [Oscillospiraceae bacterium]|nr:hypothetical protein [Oscillospiraceae bacterium]
MSNSPAPKGDIGAAGALALSISTICMFAVGTGIVGPDSFMYLAAWLFGGFLIHFYCGIICLKDGDSLNAVINLSFGTYLELVGAITFVMQWYAIIGGKTGIGGGMLNAFPWIPLTAALWIWSYAIFRGAPKAVGVGIAAADVAFPLTCAAQFAAPFSPVLMAQFNFVAGIFLLILSLCFAYMGTAGLVNTVYQRPIFPMGGPLIKSKVK